MKKLFISQPMSDKTDDEIFITREKAIESAKQILGDQIEVIDSFIHDDAPQGVIVGLWYLAKSLELLSTADVAYFAKGWKSARGCRIEKTCAHEYGINTIVEEGDF